MVSVITLELHFLQSFKHLLNYGTMTDSSFLTIEMQSIPKSASCRDHIL